ncbi:hypothetical protein GCM10011588_35210 [Nocardia jinanensis]|uniref:Uncharacterized protein n=1 Tax=Nocardia jinanensis TaxID=382504 RepID=A0A917RNU8_9NOCA|nr:hypothetical protein GCM10011588_35210 [Nocardia jinanensis]
MACSIVIGEPLLPAASGLTSPEPPQALTNASPHAMSGISDRRAIDRVDVPLIKWPFIRAGPP